MGSDSKADLALQSFSSLKPFDSGVEVSPIQLQSDLPDRTRVQFLRSSRRMAHAQGRGRGPRDDRIDRFDRRARHADLVVEGSAQRAGFPDIPRKSPDRLFLPQPPQDKTPYGLLVVNVTVRDHQHRVALGFVEPRDGPRKVVAGCRDRNDRDVLALGGLLEQIECRAQTGAVQNAKSAALGMNGGDAIDLLARRVVANKRANFFDAILIGVAQVAALVPGISRSGVTIAAGQARGLSRRQAATFSFLLSAPIIAGAGLVSLASLASSDFLLGQDRKSTRLNSSHTDISRMPSSA